jgi:hypothetical protein
LSGANVGSILSHAGVSWAERGGQFGQKDLESDRPLVAEVFVEIDDRHAAAAELALEPLARLLSPAKRGAIPFGMLSTACPLPPARD